MFQKSNFLIRFIFCYPPGGRLVWYMRINNQGQVLDPRVTKAEINFKKFLYKNLPLLCRPCPDLVQHPILRKLTNSQTGCIIKVSPPEGRDK